MAIMTTQQRNALQADFMRLPYGDCALTKAQLRAAIDAADAWASANAAAFNSALPAAAQSGLTTAQKALLLREVITRRWSVGA